MSKPIKVVVVVIAVVVFVKKLGQKIVDPKIIKVQKLQAKNCLIQNFG